jgi:phage regulator Rha-like protein
MDNMLKFNQVEERIVTLRGVKVIMDSDVAVLYGVETKRVNEAVKNNPDKFPEGYIIELSSVEKAEVVEIFDHLTRNKFSPTLPKAFTEKGLYMLATILKSEKATQTTIAIVETFAKIRELSRAVSELSETKDAGKQKSLMQYSGEILDDLLGDDLNTSDTETTLELNFAVLKLKHTVKRKEK